MRVLSHGGRGGIKVRDKSVSFCVEGMPQEDIVDKCREKVQGIYL